MRLVEQFVQHDFISKAFYEGNQYLTIKHIDCVRNGFNHVIYPQIAIIMDIIKIKTKSAESVKQKSYRGSKFVIGP